MSTKDFASYNVKRQTILGLLISLAVVALASTIVVVYSLLIFQAPYSTNASGGTSGIPVYRPYSLSVSIPIAITSWVGFGVVFAFWRGNYGRSIWRKAGLDKNVYDLIVKMRGGNSRLELLRNLESLKQRNELTLLTGIDWKEVDRNIGLLLSYGLVSVHVESGAVKIYKLTQQGQLLLKLVDELNG